MIARIGYRLLQGLITLVVVYTLTFLMIVIIPGNPLQQGERQLAPQIEQALRLRYQMDNNWTYYWSFLRGAIRFDFGPTFTYQDWTCNQILASALPVSALLGFLAILLAVGVGVPVGVANAVHRGGWVDGVTVVLVLAGISVPTFVTGVILLSLFALYWPVAPMGGWGTLAHLPLPVVTLSLPFTAYVVQLTRASMAETLSQPFIRTAFAKGVSRRQAIWKHAFPVAFLPVLSYLGPACAQAMTGSFVVEQVFGVPGLGQHFVNAALNRDTGLILASVLAFAAIMVLLNLVIDILHALIDPRVTESV